MESCPAPPRHAPEPEDEYARSRALATVGEIDRWFKFGNERYAPKAWTVTRPDDVPPPWQQLKGGQAKSVYRATVKGRSVIIKKTKHGDERKNSGGGVLYLEMVFLEALRGRPGVPELFGAWRDGVKITYVVTDGGEPLGKGPSGVGTQPNVMTAALRRLRGPLDVRPHFGRYPRDARSMGCAPGAAGQLHVHRRQEHAARRRGPRPERAGRASLYETLPVAALNKSIPCPA